MQWNRIIHPAASCGTPPGSGRNGSSLLCRAVRVLAALALWFAAPAGFGHAAPAGNYYLRAGIGFDRPAGTRFTDVDCSSTTPAALYGCGTGGDGAPYRSTGDFGTASVLELGFGFTAAPAVRLEFLLEYRPRFAFSGRANFLEPERRQSVRADLSSISGMLAAWVDLPGAGSFRLFVGAGLGAARTRIGETRMTFPRTTTLVPGGSRTGLAWMLAAGVAKTMNERLTLDLAWRYTDSGQVRTGRGEGQVVWRDGSREPLPLDLAPTRARLTSHGLRLSLRYAF